VNDGSELPLYEVGDRLDVLYHANFPEVCVVNIFFEKWGDILWMWMFALLAFVSSLPFYIYQQRKLYLHKKRLVENKSSMQAYQKKLLELRNTSASATGKRVVRRKRRQK
jgi:hypothetical protein